jgi:hypothetical protein
MKSVCKLSCDDVNSRGMRMVFIPDEPESCRSDSSLFGDVFSTRPPIV